MLLETSVNLKVVARTYKPTLFKYCHL